MRGIQKALSVSVQTDVYSTKSVNLSNVLPTGSSIGLFVKNVNESDLVQYDLKNIKYTATETSSGQAWNPERDIYLNNEVCSVHAYYPYDEGISDITNIPVSTDGQVDYMYCSNPVNVSITNSKETLQMAHALSVITLNIQRGTYTGTGVVSQVGFVGAGIAKSAILNAKTGMLSEFVGASEQIVNATDLTMQEAGQAVHTLIVPNGVESNVKISVWVDGVEYVVTAASCLFEQGYRYEYTLTVDKGELGLSNVQIGDWGYNHLGNPVLWAGNYSITLTGDVDSMAFFNEYKEDGSYRVTAIGMREGLLVYPVVCQQMEIAQQFDESKRVIDIGTMSENIVLEFNGFGTHDEYQERFFPAGTHYWTMPEGITSQTGELQDVVDVFLVGGGSGGNGHNGGCGGYTITYRGSNYVAPESGTWEGSSSEGRDGNAIMVEPGVTVEIIVGSGGGVGESGTYSQFMNENYRAEGGALDGGGSGISGSNGGSDGDGSGGQGHTTRDFGEPSGGRNAGGGGHSLQATHNPYVGGTSEYTVGSGGDGAKNGNLYPNYFGGGGGGGYGGGGGGSSISSGQGRGGDGTVLLRYWIWHKK